MAKTNNLHIRIDPVVQERAGKVLKRLGMSIPGAVTIFLNQVSLEGGMPFQIKLPLNEKEKQPFCYGVYLGEKPNSFDAWFAGIRRRFTQEFRAKVDEWLEQAQFISRERLGSRWKSEDFWRFVLTNDENYGAFQTFEKLFNVAGLHLIYCYSNEPNNSLPVRIPPFVAGFYLNKIDTELARNREKPRKYSSMLGKLLGVFAKIEEDDLTYWGIDWEMEDIMEKIYNRDAPILFTDD
jgi:addiction module RelB/DinJ family antitoxin